MIIIWSFGMVRQKDCRRVVASLGYKVRTRPARAIEQEKTALETYF